MGGLEARKPRAGPFHLPEPLLAAPPNRGVPPHSRGAHVIQPPEDAPSPPTRALRARRPGLADASLTLLVLAALVLDPPPAGDVRDTSKVLGPALKVRAKAVLTGSLVIVGGGSLPDAVRLRFLELAGGKK